MIEKGLNETDVIVLLLDKEIRNALKQDQIRDDKTLDGMDITLCAIHHNTNKIYFTCAQTTLYLLRKGEIEMFKGDKYPVGGAQAEVKTFSVTEVQLEEGDRIYMYSDGIVDQFGGPQRRKFTPKRLQQMIIDLQPIPVSEQTAPITEVFDEWKGRVEQIDDMTLMGFQIT